MTTQDRLRVIREKLKKPSPASAPKPGGLHAASHPETPPATKKRKWRAPTCGHVYLGGPAFLSPKVDFQRNGWLRHVAPVAEREWQPKPRREPHALTKIAEKWLHAPKTRAKV